MNETGTPGLCKMYRLYQTAKSPMPTDKNMINQTAENQLVLSLFPGIDMLGRGFELAGFCVVRGPELILGQDIRDFRPVAGRFDGVIGGSPCQDFSRARRSPPTGYGIEMLEEYRRVVLTAKPKWWVLENVPTVPNMEITGYSHMRIDLNSKEFGSKQSRLRHFQFGHREGWVPIIERQTSRTYHGSFERCCMASEGGKVGRRSWQDFVELQGLPSDFKLPGFSRAGAYRAVGNGVHIGVAHALATAIAAMQQNAETRLCSCGCGRVVDGQRLTAGDACRQRLSRKKRFSLGRVNSGA